MRHKKGVIGETCSGQKKSIENTRDSPPYLRSSISDRPTRMLGAGPSRPASLLTHNRKHWSPNSTLTMLRLPFFLIRTLHDPFNYSKLHYTATKVFDLTDMKFFLVSVVLALPAGGGKKHKSQRVGAGLRGVSGR